VHSTQSNGKVRLDLNRVTCLQDFSQHIVLALLAYTIHGCTLRQNDYELVAYLHAVTAQSFIKLPLCDLLLIRNFLYIMFVRSSRTTPLRQLVSSFIQTRGIATSPIVMAPGISDAIKKDHREIESYYDKIINSSDKDEQTRFQNLFTWELARHSIGEELVVYPVFEKLLPGGIEMANKDRKEHLKVNLNC
jgi:hypothetical protein